MLGKVKLLVIGVEGVEDELAMDNALRSKELS
jgi:hypothetical protein